MSNGQENQLLVAVKALVIWQRKLLILHTSQTEELPGVWEFPGGKMEFGEEIESALIRETREETGLMVEVESLLYAATFYTRPWRQLVILAHRCRSRTGDVVLSEEHDDYLWVGRKSARETISSPILLDFDRYRVLENLDID